MLLRFGVFGIVGVLAMDREIKRKRFLMLSAAGVFVGLLVLLYFWVRC